MDRQQNLPLDLPAAPCVIPAEVADQLRQMRESQQKIETALIGDSRLGHKGLVARVEKIEETVERHDRKLLVWGSIVAFSAIVLEFIKDFFTSRSH